MNDKKRIAKRSPAPAKTQATSSWGGVAEWYDKHLEEGKDTYQEAVIAPNLIRVVGPKKGMKIVDIACGQGFFSRKFAERGADVVGADAEAEAGSAVGAGTEAASDSGCTLARARGSLAPRTWAALGVT